MTILAAIILHIVTATVFSYVLPLLEPAPKIADVTEFEWVDVDLDEVIVVDEEAIPSEAQELLPAFDAETLVVPQLNVPETSIEPFKPPAPVEIPKPQPKPQIVTEKPPAQPKTSDDTPEKKSDEQSQDARQLMGKPPVVINEVLPESGSGLGYKGYVSIAVRIGKDGKVKVTEILQSSGRYFVDEIALKAARQWTFRPALDQIGRPMECDKIITFDVKLNAR